MQELNQVTDDFNAAGAFIRGLGVNDHLFDEAARDLETFRVIPLFQRSTKLTDSRCVAVSDSGACLPFCRRRGDHVSAE
jgi:hypothetical protein